MGWVAVVSGWSVGTGADDSGATASSELAVRRERSLAAGGGAGEARRAPRPAEGRARGACLARGSASILAGTTRLFPGSRRGPRRQNDTPSASATTGRSEPRVARRARTRRDRATRSARAMRSQGVPRGVPSRIPIPLGADGARFFAGTRSSGFRGPTRGACRASPTFLRFKTIGESIS